MENKIYYTKGYKYQLEKEYRVKTPIIGYDIKTPFITLTLVGLLILEKGFAWDGPSGPTLDDSTNMRASAIHDAFYKLMRNELMPLSEREAVDKFFKLCCLEDGMIDIRAEYYYIAVRKFADSNAQPKNKKQVFCAP